MRKLSMDELNRLSAEEFRAIEKLPYILILDDIRSMNNVGSVFRTADAFKAEKIYLCGITAISFTLRKAVHESLIEDTPKPIITLVCVVV
jgi:tRNA G18 (ribose-2'-O)-methylase SpoU